MSELKKKLRDLFPKDMRKFNHPERNTTKKIYISFRISPKQKRGIDYILESGKFTSRSGFLRYLIVKYFDEMSHYE